VHADALRAHTHFKFNGRLENVWTARGTCEIQQTIYSRPESRARGSRGRVYAIESRKGERCVRQWTEGKYLCDCRLTITLCAALDFIARKRRCDRKERRMDIYAANHIHDNLRFVPGKMATFKRQAALSETQTRQTDGRTNGTDRQANWGRGHAPMLAKLRSVAARASRDDRRGPANGDDALEGTATNSAN
jgi:hypothetical protein